MRGIKTCINWLIDNPGKYLESNNYSHKVKYNEEQIFIDRSGKEEIYDGGMRYFNLAEWKPVKELISFVDAINSEKKVYPNVFLPHDEDYLEKAYRTHDNYSVAVMSFLSYPCINHKHYINCQWYIED